MGQNTLKKLIKDTITEVLSPFKQQMKDEIKSMKESVQFMSDSYEEYRVTMKNIKEQLKTISKENEQNSYPILETKINNLEQKKRSNNLVITGIPKQKDEDVGKVVQKVLTTLKELIEKKIYMKHTEKEKMRTL
ncbi:hypothetical protein HHI36_003188 [Cryptolaemus montrouzieri]|uniref:Uncharacterized protein n=1 Tax=Cryptolaemus montrouzieri TaxID=559131 RepID=A0ABD2PCP9_9CUCU